MRIEFFNKRRDFETLVKWCDGRKYTLIDLERIPTGLVCFDEDKHLAMVFIHKTDSGIGLLSDLISDPESSKSKRELAIGCLIESFMALGSSWGLQKLSFSTKLKTIIDRTERYGFDKIDEGHSWFGRDI